MRRIISVLAAMAIVAAMVAAMAMPAFAGGKCTFPTGEFIQCAGGSGSQGGGGGGRFAGDVQTFVEFSGGGGGQGGGGGGRCASGDTGGQQGCVGSF